MSSDRCVSRRPPSARSCAIRKRAASLEKRVGRLTENLGLTPDQATQMTAALERQNERNVELKTMWTSGASSEAIGEVKQTNAAEHQATLETFLTPDQLETYTASRSGGKQ